MNSFLWVALGGAIGSMARHGVNLLSLRGFGAEFPAATMIVNITGSILMGMVAGYMAYHEQWSQEIRSFTVVGILGGFTTFSAFSLDIITLYERGNYIALAAYTALSLIVSFAGLLAGLTVMRNVFS